MTRARERQRRANRSDGFTMIEIMLVLALIGLIMGSVVYALRKRAIDAQTQVARLQTSPTPATTSSRGPCLERKEECIAP